MSFSHIIFLELSALSLARRCFWFLQGNHVLLGPNNTMMVSYINRQGGVRSHCLHSLVHRMILLSSDRFLSLRVMHIPGTINAGTDILSRGAPVYGEWSLHPAVVEQIWPRFGRASVDLFASRNRWE